jgi:hypothetical protein
LQALFVGDEPSEHPCPLHAARMMGLTDAEADRGPYVTIRINFGFCPTCDAVRTPLITRVMQIAEANCCCTGTRSYVLVRIPLCLRNHYHMLVNKRDDGVKANFKSLYHFTLMDDDISLVKMMREQYGDLYVERLRVAMPLMREFYDWAYPVCPQAREVDVVLKPTDQPEIGEDMLDMYRLGSVPAQCEFDVADGFLEKEVVHPMVPEGALLDDYGVYANKFSNVLAAIEKRFPQHSHQGYMSTGAETTFLKIADLFVADFDRWLKTAQAEEAIAELANGTGPASMSAAEYAAIAADFHSTTDVALFKHREIFIKRELSKLVKMKPRIIFCFHRARTALEWIFATIVTKYWAQLAEPMTIKNISRARLCDRFEMNRPALDLTTDRLLDKAYELPWNKQPKARVITIEYACEADGKSWDGSVGAVASHPLLVMYSRVHAMIGKNSLATQEQIKALLRAVADECNLTLLPNYEVLLPPDYQTKPSKTKWRFSQVDEHRARQVFIKHLREMMRSGRMLTSVGNAIVSEILQIYTDFDNPFVVARAFLSDERERPVQSGTIRLAGHTVYHARIAYVEGDDAHKHGRFVLLTDEHDTGTLVSDVIREFAERICTRAGQCGFAYEGKVEVISIKEDGEYTYPFLDTRAVDFSAELLAVGVAKTQLVCHVGSVQPVVLSQFVGGYLIYTEARLLGFVPDLMRALPKLIQRPNSLGGMLDDLAYLLGLMSQTRQHPEMHALCTSLAVDMIEALTDTEDKRKYFEESMVSLNVDRGVQMAMLGEVTQRRTNGRVLRELLVREIQAADAAMPFDAETMRAIPFALTAIQECLLGGH